MRLGERLLADDALDGVTSRGAGVAPEPVARDGSTDRLPLLTRQRRSAALAKLAHHPGQVLAVLGVEAAGLAQALDQRQRPSINPGEQDGARRWAGFLGFVRVTALGFVFGLFGVRFVDRGAEGFGVL